MLFALRLERWHSSVETDIEMSCNGNQRVGQEETLGICLRQDAGNNFIIAMWHDNDVVECHQ